MSETDDGRTVAEFLTLPPEEREAIFRDHLVQDDPVIMQEGDDGGEMITLLLELFCGRSASRARMTSASRW